MVDWRPSLTSRDVNGSVKVFVSVEILAAIGDKNRVFIAHGDPGWKKDSFGLVIGCPGEDFDEELALPSVDIVAVLWWDPDPIQRQPVDFINVKDVIIELHKIYNFAQVTFDQFHSALLIQQLIEAGVPAQDLSFSGQMQLEMYRNTRTLVNNGLMSIAAFRRVYKEMQQLLKTKTRPDHPEGGAKDLADGVAAVSYFACQPDIYNLTRTTVIITDSQSFLTPEGNDGSGYPRLTVEA